jgi:hypothetical protein
VIATSSSRHELVTIAQAEHLHVNVLPLDHTNSVRLDEETTLEIEEQPV